MSLSTKYKDFKVTNSEDRVIYYNEKKYGIYKEVDRELNLFIFDSSFVCIFNVYDLLIKTTQFLNKRSDVIIVFYPTIKVATSFTKDVVSFISNCSNKRFLI